MIELWQNWDLRYLAPAFIGGTGVAIVSGPLGAMMVWRRLAYFGDTLSHSGLLGITLALALHINITLGVCAIALLVALGLLGLQQKLLVASDTLLGLLSHTTLALGLLILATMERIQVDVLGFLYGDILALTWQDVGWIYLGGVIVILLLMRLWQSLLRVTVDPDLAQVEGVPVKRVQATYLLLLAIVVAVAIKIVGVLLITALLLIPATTARPWAHSPEKMAVYASIFGIISVMVGIISSHFWDVPTGPAIVVSSTFLLLITLCIKK